MKDKKAYESGKRCLRTSEIAHILGFSKRSVNRMLKEGILPGIVLSKGIRKTWGVMERDLEAWLESRRTKPIEAA